MTNIETETIVNDSAQEIEDQRLKAEKIERDTRARFEKILNGPKSSDYNFRQMQLAAALFIKENPGAIELDQKTRDAMASEWQTLKYSDKWREMIREREAEFKSHPRFQGNVANVELADLLYFIDSNGKFPEK